jgi:NitT/TauT family transport system substrate-binding protein
MLGADVCGRTVAAQEGFTDVQYVFGHQLEVAKMSREGAFDLNAGFSAKSMYNLEHEQHPLKYLSGLHVGCYALVGSERTRSVRDLKGKTVWAGAVKNDGLHIFFSAIVSYVGMDPRTDVNYVWVDKDEAIRLFRDGKIDAFMSFPPGSHELMHKGIGHLLVDTNVDKPWSQYFCCMVSGRSDFINKNPIATKRALRAILKGNRYSLSRSRARDANSYREQGHQGNRVPAYVPELTHIPYGNWREYNPEDTIRFYALRMRDIGMIKSTPQQFMDQHADWSFMNDLKKEFWVKW